MIDSIAELASRSPAVVHSGHLLPSSECYVSCLRVRGERPLAEDTQKLLICDKDTAATNNTNTPEPAVYNALAVPFANTTSH
ncbi:hypothetical protein LSAT2_031656 [Lamellibrachia satsuma]|nr:hypothetical protein LSAT2_031656 [Lamellibrachia satsuma]